jgi:MFS family permease
MDHADLEPRGLAAPLYALPFLGNGLVAGFVTVTLAYVLSRHGVSVAAIAGLLALTQLPATCQFLAGPIVDASLSPRRWYVISSGLLAACFGAYAVTPMTAAGLPVLGGLCLASGAASVTQYTAGMAAMAATTPAELRGPIAGWAQTANLGGTGLGGGLGLWIVGHAGGSPAAGWCSRSWSWSARRRSF